jgi:hypothetical protein
MESGMELNPKYKITPEQLFAFYKQALKEVVAEITTKEFGRPELVPQIFEVKCHRRNEIAKWQTRLSEVLRGHF